MTDKTLMTPMQVWLHPCRAASLIEETVARADSLAGELQSAKDMIGELQQENEDLKQIRSRLQALNTEQGLKLVRAREENAAMYKELEEITSMMERMVEVKVNYEKRIARLKSKIVDLRGALRREIEAAPGELEPLPDPPKQAVQKPKPDPEPPDSAADWYSPLDLS